MSSSPPVTAGLDFGLVMIAELRSRFYTECTQLVSGFAPQPPFNSGSMKTAPAKVKADTIELLAGFTKQAEELASATTERG